MMTKINSSISFFRQFTKRMYCSCLISGLLSAMACSIAYGQIRIGHTSGITGPSAASVLETRNGMMLYIDSINERGGVNGERIEVHELDDQFKPELTAQNAKALANDKKVVGFLLTRGTPNCEAVMKLLDELRVPLVGPSTGALVLHEPVNRWVFNVRPTYRIEAEKTILLLNTLGAQRIAMVHTDDSFGVDASAGYRKGFDKVKLEPQFHLRFDRAKPDFSGILSALKKQSPDAVVIAASAAVSADLVKQARAAGSKAQFATLSNNASNGFVKALGNAAHGVIVSQVYPADASKFPLVFEANQLAKSKGKAELSGAEMEGYAAAKVLVAGLRKINKGKITGESLRNALEALSDFDAGGLSLSYSPTDHTGFEYVDLSIISKSGQFLR